MRGSPRPNALYLIGAIGAIIAVTAGFRFWLQLNNPTIAALLYLLVILVTATVSTLWTAVVASVLAVLCLNYFFMPPVGTFTIADPQDWGALFAFLAISIAVAMGIERVQLLEERKTAQLARQNEELKSALLASLAHDLRTPLTAIRVAASNLQGSWLTEEQRREQSELVLAEVERLTRLFQNILEMARIEAGAISAEVGRIRVGDLTIDFDRRRVIRGDAEIRLTPREFELLALFAHNPDRVLTHRTILKAIWGPNAVDNPEHLWVLIGQLRRKIEPDPAHPKCLLSEPWVGYRFATEP